MKELLEHLDDRIWDSTAPVAEKCDMSRKLNRIRTGELEEKQINTIIDDTNARLKFWASPDLRRNQRSQCPEKNK